METETYPGVRCGICGERVPAGQLARHRAHCNRATACGCPWAHCRLLCVTPCDHDDPCPHHYRKPDGLRVRLARGLRSIAGRLEAGQ